MRFSDVKGNIVLPPAHATEKDVIPTFRFVDDKNNITEKDFYPSPFKNLKKLNRVIYSQEDEGRFAISFYCDLEIAKIKLNNSCWKDRKEIAQGQIKKNWGQCDTEDTSKHINLWKYDSVSYSIFIPYFN